MISNPRLKNITYKSFALAYKKFALPLMKFLVKKTGGDYEAAEEVFSQTIEAGLKSYGAFQHKSTFFTWICKIALNKMADYYRQQVNEKSLLVAPAFETLANLGSKEITPEEKLALDELKTAVWECIRLLPEEKRKLLYLKYWKDLSLKEMAKLMGSSERAIEGKLYRAKQALRTIVLENHPEILPVPLWEK